MSTPLSVGFLGLGAMGARMAVTLARAGFPVRGFDVSPRAREHVGEDVEVLDDPREAAAGADAVVVMVATGAQLHDVLFGERGIADALGEGAVLLVMATVGPQALESCAQGLAGRGVRIVDAPVSGRLAWRQGRGEARIATSAAAAVFQPVGDTTLERWNGDCRLLAVKIDQVVLELAALRPLITTLPD